MALCKTSIILVWVFAEELKLTCYKKEIHPFKLSNMDVERGALQDDYRLYKALDQLPCQFLGIAMAIKWLLFLRVHRGSSSVYRGPSDVRGHRALSRK